jgi:acyl-CoA thioesterase FadM
LLTAMFFSRFASRLKVTDVSVRNFRVWITDVDVSMMNHAAMMTVMETGRIDFMVRTGFFKLATKNNWYVPSAAISVRFFRPLKMFQKATVKTRVFHINGPWIYLEQVITRNDRDIAACIVKSTVKKGRQHIDASEVLKALNASEIPLEGKNLVEVYENEMSLMAERINTWNTASHTP